jgi:peroxiredoxin family protein
MRVVTLAHAARCTGVSSPESVALAIVVTRGTSNNLFQVATLVRAATALEMPVRVLFEGEAVLKLGRSGVSRDEWAEVYAPVLKELGERLAAAEFESMEQFLRDAREHGEDVRFWASAETMTSTGTVLDDLVASVDGARSRADFEKEAERSIRLFF